MDMILPVTDAQQLYKQWQDGKLLDVEERKALRPSSALDSTNGISFAEMLKSSGKTDN
jgi:hypothetical protein